MSWTLIESQTLSGNASSVTLGSGGTIPQTYKALRLIFSARSTAAAVGDDTTIRFNGDSGANYTFRRLYGSGSVAGSDTASQTQLYLGNASAGANATASTFGSAEVFIPNYTSSLAKVIVSEGLHENNATSAYSALIAGKWSGTAAITSITIYPSGTSPNFVANSSFTLYGLS